MVISVLWQTLVTYVYITAAVFKDNNRIYDFVKWVWMALGNAPRIYIW